MSVRRVAEKTARISANACAWKEIFPAVNAMSCAVAYMRKQTPSSAPRTLYLVGKEVSTGDYVKNAVCCSMCKRMVINAGIARVIVRDDHDRFREIDVQDWIINDESIEGVFGY